jgi:hypothetical protein
MSVNKFSSNMELFAILHATISQKMVICVTEEEFMTEHTNKTILYVHYIMASIHGGCNGNHVQ